MNPARLIIWCRACWLTTRLRWHAEERAWHEAQAELARRQMIEDDSQIARLRQQLTQLDVPALANPTRLRSL